MRKDGESDPAGVRSKQHGTLQSRTRLKDTSRVTALHIVQMHLLAVADHTRRWNAVGVVYFARKRQGMISSFTELEREYRRTTGRSSRSVGTDSVCTPPPSVSQAPFPF